MMPTPDPFDYAIRLVQGVGFPAAVAWYVLVRLERTMLRMAEQLAAIRTLLEKGPARG